MKKFSLILVGSVLLLAGGCASPERSPELRTEPTELIVAFGPDNFHRVSPELYRSEQPTAAEFRVLSEHGIRSVLNLRRHHSDQKLLAGTGLTLYELGVNSGSLTESQLRTALLIIRQAEKPILVHCWHGSDRTGAVVAAYRIVEENWAVEDAVNEMVHGGYRHSSFIYRNLQKLLHSIDWVQMKADLD